MTGSTALEKEAVEIVNAVGRAADERRWDDLRALFAPRVVLDYGAPALLGPDEIVALWRPLFAGFDRTRHVVSGARVELRDVDRARVSSRFEADHHIDGAPGGEDWRLEGRYEHELVRQGGAWKISRMRMIPGKSSGNGDLIARARERGKAPPMPAPTYKVERVEFKSGGETLVGLLHLPVDAPAGKRLPAAIVVGTWTSVKEQIAYLYAQRLAPAGFAVLTMDYRGFGESEGAPRHFESPPKKIEDLEAAVDMLSSHAAVDPQRIALVGVCASAGYVAAEAARDPRVKSVVMIAPWLHDAAIVEAVYGGREAYGGVGVAALVAEGKRAAARYAASKTVDYAPAASTTDPRAAMYWPDPQFLDYYIDPMRGGIPQWGNRLAVMSWPDWLGFDALASAPRLRQPTLIVHSEQAAIPEGVHRYAAAMPDKPKLVWMDGTQFHFYDDLPTIDRATAEAAAHLRATLR